MFHLSFYVEDLIRRAYFGDLFELTVEKASEILQPCIDPSQKVTTTDIENALKEAINNGELKPVRGSLHNIGGVSLPPVLRAPEIQDWAEKNGLLIHSDEAWHDYMYNESILVNKLLSSLSALRERNKEKPITGDRDLDALHDELINQYAQNDTLLDEIERLKEEKEQFRLNGEEPIHPRREKSYLRLVAVLLEYISGDFPAKVDKHPSFENETELIERIAELGEPGLSKSNLQRLFPKAKRELRGG